MCLRKGSQWWRRPLSQKGRYFFVMLLHATHMQSVKKILKNSKRVDDQSATQNEKKGNTVDVNDVLDENFSTGLHVAAEKDLHDMVKLLLHHNANPSLIDLRQNPPFKLAKSKKVRDAFRLCIWEVTQINGITKRLQWKCRSVDV